MLPPLFHELGSEPSMVPAIYQSSSDVLRSSLSTLVLRFWVPQPIGRRGRGWQYCGVKRTELSRVGVGDAIRVSIKKERRALRNAYKGL
jgi:hypothetical protein